LKFLRLRPVNWSSSPSELVMSLSLECFSKTRPQPSTSASRPFLPTFSSRASTHLTFRRQQVGRPCLADTWILSRYSPF
jgi:hypothetical protein